MTAVALVLFLTLTLAATPARADHGAAFRVEGLSPLASALLTGGLALLVALIVAVLIIVFTRPSAKGGDRES